MPVIMSHLGREMIDRNAILDIIDKHEDGARSWFCAKCGKMDVPASHVTYDETHETSLSDSDNCGGTVISMPCDDRPLREGIKNLSRHFYENVAEQVHISGYRAIVEAIDALRERIKE